MSARTIALVTAIITIACAVFGVLYNGWSLAADLGGAFTEAARDPEMQHFYGAFYTMSAVSIACYLTLLVGGVQLVRRRRWAPWLLLGVWVFEIVYFFAVGALWRVSAIGPSVAGATGVANGGMMAQFFILLPIWGPVVVLWARQRAVSTSES
jgi:hypothetical protein